MTTETTNPRSAMNGFTHPLLKITTLMNDEDFESQKAFATEYINDLAPVGAVEFHMARTLALDNWRLNRIKAIEENIFAYGYEVFPALKHTSSVPQIENAICHAGAWLMHCNALNKLSLHESRLHRNIVLTENRLRNRQNDRLKNAVPNTYAQAA